MVSSEGLLKILKAGDLNALNKLIQGPHGFTTDELDDALTKAVRHSSPEVIDFFFRHGAHISEGVDRNANQRGEKEVYEALLRNGWDINSIADGFPALMSAIERKPALVRWLLEQGADPNILSEMPGWSNSCHDIQKPLEWAAKVPDATALEILLSYGAEMDPNALYVAIAGMPRNSWSELSHVRHMKALLCSGYNINYNLEWGGTPLHFAIEYGRSDMMEFLVEEGADVDYWSWRHGTPLHSAVRHNREEMLQYLMGKGLDLSLRDTQGRTAAELAKGKGYLDLSAILEGRDDDWNIGKTGGHSGDPEHPKLTNRRRRPNGGMWYPTRAWDSRPSFYPDPEYFDEGFEEYIEDIRYLWP